jgi:hyperosmotically inducible periplasmic protein
MRTLMASLLFCVLVVGVAYVFLSRSGSSGALASDAVLLERIESELDREATLRDQDIEVDVNHGVATLNGTVATEADRTRAALLAKTGGAAEVQNHIGVGTNQTLGSVAVAEDQLKSSIGKGAEATRRGFEKAGEALSQAGGEVTDAWILSDIKAQFLGETLLKGSNINVDCDQRVVTLGGTVPTRAGRHRAMVIARRTNGVTRVVDRLEIVPEN